MRVLVLKSSFVLVEWIKLLAELTVSCKVVSEIEANIEIKQFLSSTLAECVGHNPSDVCEYTFHYRTHNYFFQFNRVEEDGISCDDKEDALISRIEHIVRDKLHCDMPFDEQTMEHVRALVGAYSSLLIENYSQR